MAAFTGAESPLRSAPSRLKTADVVLCSGQWRGDSMHGQGEFTARDGCKLRIGRALNRLCVTVLFACFDQSHNPLSAFLNNSPVGK